MNTQSSAMPESFDAPQVAPRVMSPTRPFYWSVRRELWENRSIYIAPLAAAGVYLLAYMVGVMRLPHGGHSGVEMIRRHAIAEPYDFAAGLLMVTAMIVGVFYCLDALHGERRDRSILFWKSLPVSDVTTVLAKASIPLAVLPALTITITLATQFLVLMMSSMALAASGQSVGAYWEQLSWFQMWAMLVYHLLTVHLLGHAPFYAWFLLVSAWARRAAFLWAVLPLIAIGFRREDRVRHNIFCASAGASIDRRLGGSGLSRSDADRPHDAHHAWTLSGQSRFVAGTGGDCGLSLCSRAGAAQSRTDLTGSRALGHEDR